jgi:hypothetical protein
MDGLQQDPGLRIQYAGYPRDENDEQDQRGSKAHVRALEF